MPKDEFDFEDPMELSGVALLTAEDTTDAMAECFIEEFMRMGYNHQQILALFRNPHYLGMNLVMQRRGEAFVRDYVAEVFARWGKRVTWPQAAAPGAAAAGGDRGGAGALGHEGPGVAAEPPPQETEMDPAATDPMGAAVPRITLH